MAYPVILPNLNQRPMERTKGGGYGQVPVGSPIPPGYEPLPTNGSSPWIPIRPVASQPAAQPSPTRYNYATPGGMSVSGSGLGGMMAANAIPYGAMPQERVSRLPGLSTPATTPGFDPAAEDRRRMLQAIYGNVGGTGAAPDAATVNAQIGTLNQQYGSNLQEMLRRYRGG